MKKKCATFAALCILFILGVTNSVLGAPGDLLWEDTINFSAPYYNILSVGDIGTTISPSYLALSFGTHTANKSAAHVVVYDLITGQKKMSATVTTWSYLSVAINGNTLAVSHRTNNGILTYYFYNINTGRKLWAFTKPVSEDTVYQGIMPAAIAAGNDPFVLLESLGGSASTPGHIHVQVYQLGK